MIADRMPSKAGRTLTRSSKARTNERWVNVRPSEWVALGIGPGMPYIDLQSTVMTMSSITLLIPALPAPVLPAGLSALTLPIALLLP